MTEYSRRDFLKGAGVAAAGAVAAGTLAGCASADTSKKDAPAADWMPAAWDYETDVLVIGYGGAGLWAALTAFDEGESDVLVLEKAPTRGGGNSSINMGEFTWVDDVEKATKYITGFSLGWTPEDLARAWAEECYNNLDYCDHWGVDAQIKKGTNASAGNLSVEYPYVEGAEAMHVCSVGDNGNGFWQQLDKVRADLGIEVMFSCHDEELIQNPETKEIVGAYTLIGDDKTPKAVKARKGVILTLGGFEFNEDMKQQYLRCYPMRGFYGWPFNTGDGIPMITKVNAQLWNMNNTIGNANTWIKEFEQPYAFMLTPRSNNYIMVDRLGNRWRAESNFFNPHLGWHEFTKFNDAELCDFERIPTWVIMDKTGVEGGPLGQMKGGVLANPAFSTSIGMMLEDVPPECGAFEGWSEDNSVEIEKGWIKKGDTIEGGPSQDRKREGRHRGVQPVLRCGSRPRLQPRPRHAGARPRAAVLRLPAVSWRMHHAGRPEEERERPGAGHGRRGHPAPVRGRQLWQLPAPHLRHIRWRQRREHGVGPHRRPPCRRA